MKSSNLQRMLLITATLLLTGVVGASHCLGWSLASQPLEGILVLRNGNILRGKIQQQGKHYHVHLPNGQLRVRENQVELSCQNLQEAYQHRRATRGGTTADSHLALAAWCLRHDLFDQAESEIQEAAEIDSGHRRLGLLRRQLKISRQLAAREQQSREQQSPVTETGPTAKSAPLDPASLDKAPPWARALFVRQIQPLVVNSCAASGCHQSGTESNYQLNRLAVDGAGHPEATLRNLAATLQQIDWQAAEQSDLLRLAKKAHGGSDASVPLPPHKLQVLHGWVEQLAEAHHKSMQPKLISPKIEVAALPARPIPTKKVEGPSSSDVQPAGFQQADPFDPSVFNRQFAPVKEEASAASTEPSVPHVLTPEE